MNEPIAATPAVRQTAGSSRSAALGESAGLSVTFLSGSRGGLARKEEKKQRLFRRCRGSIRKGKPQIQKFFASFFQKRSACLGLSARQPIGLGQIQHLVAAPVHYRAQHPHAKAFDLFGLDRGRH